MVASTVELRITNGGTKLGRRILQSDGHDRTFCRSKFHLPCVGPLLYLIEVSLKGKMVAYGINRTVKNTIVGKSLIPDVVLVGRSLINIKKRMGPNTVP